MPGGNQRLLWSLLVFEEFHLAKPLFGLLFGLVGPAEIFPLFGKDFVSVGDFLDHWCSPRSVAGREESCSASAHHGSIPFPTESLSNNALEKTASLEASESWLDHADVRSYDARCFGGGLCIEPASEF